MSRQQTRIEHEKAARERAEQIIADAYAATRARIAARRETAPEASDS